MIAKMVRIFLHFAQYTGSAFSGAAPTISRIMAQLKGMVSKRFGAVVWQKSFYDHVIRDEMDFLRIWQYIDNNPARWLEDKYYIEA